MKLINFTQTLFARGARKHVPLIRFPDRHGFNKSTTVASNNSKPQPTTTSSSSSSSNKNKTYSDNSQVPQRLKMRPDEMDLVISGGAY
ncbi:hypothetical protein RB653_002638 [Dictyostelium firmibasis]|uniref:Uncharacterized protein n=1 Tax=Dictyostelium firmibasis TaxID=79012 RepID=A0AAN7TXX7_9MYCE